MFAYEFTIAGLSAKGTAGQLIISTVSGNFYSTLGIQPLHGRFSLPTEGQTLGADPVMVLGYTYWQSRFRRRPEHRGPASSAERASGYHSGRAPKGFYGVYSVADSQGYIPLSFSGTLSSDGAGFWTNRSERSIQVLGRLKPNVSLKQAQRR